MTDSAVFESSGQKQIGQIHKYGSQSRFNQMASMSKSTLLPNIGNLEEIQRKIKELGIEMEECTKNREFGRAKEINFKIEDLKKEELVAYSVSKMKKNHENAEYLRKMNQQEIEKFERNWDKIIEKHAKNIESIEQDFLKEQQAELNEFNQKLVEYKMPPTKYSPSTLHNQRILTQLVRLKKYQAPLDKIHVILMFLGLRMP